MTKVPWLAAELPAWGIAATAVEFAAIERAVWLAEWRARRFSPAEAEQWSAAGVDDASVAAQWLIDEPDAEVRTGWLAAGVTSPVQAREWARVGASAQDLPKRISDPQRWAFAASVTGQDDPDPAWGDLHGEVGQVIAWHGCEQGQSPAAVAALHTALRLAHAGVADLVAADVAAALAGKDWSAVATLMGTGQPFDVACGSVGSRPRLTAIS